MTGVLERVFLTTVFITCAMAAFRWLKEGSKCYSGQFENRTGICKRFRDCPLAYENLRNDIWPERCSFIEDEAVVCCIDEKAIEEPKDTTDTIDTTTAMMPAITAVPEDSSDRVNFGSRISEKKCGYYSMWPRVCGGSYTGSIEFPHMAHLGYLKHGKISFRCGGSLISEQFILTAAHCLQDSTGTRVSHAHLGKGGIGTAVLARVRESISHPDYRPGSKYNDIALLQLEIWLNWFNSYMIPACLHTTRDIDSEFALASGWGVTENGKESKRLVKVELPFVHISNCSKTYKSGRREDLSAGLDDDSMICAGGVELKKDTCHGDSGGPLQLVLGTCNVYAGCVYTIVGVTSFGGSCGRIPGVYTRVSYYVPWIESIVWPDGQNFLPHAFK